MKSGSTEHVKNAAVSGKPGPEEARKLVDVAIALVYAPETGKLLICRRKAESVLGGYWEFPGGKCNAGEAPADCAVRETEEETGLRVKVVRALATIVHAYPHAHVRLYPFICEHVYGVVELRAVAEARWIEPEEVEGYEFPEANRELLKEVARGGGGRH